MCNNKHLTLNDRLTIERELFFNKSFKQIGKILNRIATDMTSDREGNALSSSVAFLSVLNML